MSTAELFDGLMLIAMVCAPFFLVGLIAEAWEAFSDTE